MSRAMADARAKDMLRRWNSGASMAEIGDAYDLTRERVRQILFMNFGVTASARRAAKRAEKEARAVAHRDLSERRRAEGWGLSLPDYRALVDRFGSSDSASSPFRAFLTQRANAANRGIEWRFSFRDWWAIWEASGKWGARGRGRGYCMARRGDRGAYEAGNVYICTCADNSSEMQALRRARRVEREVAVV